MVIVASGMVRGRVRLATTSPQLGGHLFFAACRGYTTYSQQSTVFAEETVWKTFLSALIHCVFGGKIIFLQVFKYFWRGT